MSAVLYAPVHAARSALQWRMILLWVVATLIPTLVLALPFWQVFAANFDHSVHGAVLARELDLSALADVGASLKRESRAIGGAALLALAMTLLLSPFLTGVAVHAARSVKTPRLAELAVGGARHYARMLRMLVVATIPFGLAALLGRAALRLADGHAEKAILESSAALAGMAAMTVTGLLLLLAHATVDAGRAVLAADSRRSSALAAWWTGCRMLLKRPGVSLLAYLPISAAGLLAALALSVARVHMPALSGIDTIAALLLTQLTVAVLGWMRAARLFALLEVTRRH